MPSNNGDPVRVFRLRVVPDATSGESYELDLEARPGCGILDSDGFNAILPCSRRVRY